jgi:peptidyl-prolyl cis-trans isomerase D
MLKFLRSGNKRTKFIFGFLAVLTVATFVGGFIFLAGIGRDPVSRARMSGSVGSINGEAVTQSAWRTALDEARLTYRQRYGSDPQDRDIKAVEQQAWRTLVNERMFAQEARRAGLHITDNEVLVGMRETPPSVITTSPSFQTNGQFDQSKYMQALANPGNDWSPFEAMLRDQLPVRKLQEHLLSSLKLTEPELKQAFRQRFDRVAATIITVPAADTGHANASEADLAKIYDNYKSRMAAGARTQLEVLTIPKHYAQDEIKAALDMGRSLYDRARKGEDFAQLAKDYSEGPNAEKGGLIDRWLTAPELGGMIGAAVQSKKPGDLIEPIQEGGRVLLLKIMDPAQDTSKTKTPPPSPGSVKLSQIVIKVRPAAEALRSQYNDAKAIANRAKGVGLSKAATEKGLSTVKTGFYDADNSPPQLFATPEAADWGLSSKKGDVSPVFEGQDEFVIAQVALQHPAGPPSRDEIGEQLKMIADAEHRVDMAKPKADQLATAIRGGQSLEDAAKALNVAPTKISTTEQQPDPRLSGAPELVGMLFAAPRGKVLGPVRASQGWLFARVDTVTAAPDTLLNDQLKGQLTNEILSQRQRSFFDGFVEKLRAGAQIHDLRSGQGVE